jgi:uncharacterized membrane protein SpoIIM required for sporulation/ABC-type transport system involved in multi-copper enzyme maturation permease subunit
MTSTVQSNPSSIVIDTPKTTTRGFTTTLSNALIITRREVRDSFRDWRIIAPIIILTFFFPFLAQDVALRFSNFLQDYGAELIGDRMIPFLLMIVGFFPISISLVIALETFVGEKERLSLEPLLSTPLTNTELYIGKTLSAMIPPLIASFGGMTVYLLTLLGGQLQWRPEPMLIVQIFMLTIVQALVMVTGAVVVSSQTTSTRAANLLASFIIIPMTLIINGESFIMFIAPDADSPNGIGALWAIIVGMFIVVALLLRIGNSIFNREELLGRTIDAVNVRNIFKGIWKWIIAVDDKGTPARNIIDWYRRGTLYSLKKLKIGMGISIVIFSIAFVAGYGIGLQPEWQLPLADTSNLEAVGTVDEFFEQFMGTVDNPRVSMLRFIIWQNARVLIAATLLGMFSFGVAPLVLTPVVYAILGYVLSQFVIAGFDISVFAAALLPHGIIEIPVIILATTIAFRMGSVMTKPPAGKTVGYAWSVALGDSIKLWITLVIPGLLLAAVLEVFLTPLIVASVI